MKRISAILTALLLAGSLAHGQQPDRERPAERGGDRPNPRPGAGMRVGRDPLMENLYSPELIRRFADELKLTEEQKTSLRELMEKSRSQLEPQQKKAREEVEALTTILKADKVDEAAAAAQLDKVLAAENQVKKDHLVLLLGVKNILTVEQQQKLTELRKDMLQRPPGDRPPRDGRRPHDGPAPAPKDAP